MSKNKINLKMKVIKDFFHIDNAYIKRLLNKDKVSEDFNFSKLTICDVIKLAKDLQLSLAVFRRNFL